MEALDVNALPLTVPVVMASSFGATLRTPKRGTSFVELYRSGNGTIGIRNASNKDKHLCLSLYSQCSFGSPENALKFKVKEASAGRFVFEESSTGNVLEMEYQGRVSLVVCRNKYREETQSWFVLNNTKSARL
ncbi:hypothetical protein PF005_g26487 [Phytophthora fragariae]|uniref:Ricin B lectin domain-containing protein n=1 Tax=Phytophthora fragariae TaxID=53985 RepID=A0A6A3Q616_9STRA|nr:hypothetical protein PF003_g9016 [Phytophthora fragariae]KAE8922559.1 hypothetical protein PF009_g27177 [Phytophthora fragariae]KAE8973245.1 hypothetical protein PF011_g25332 [Phytophthora fragariae]KAE9069461.1 hypothetical protein PF010_g26657 [Phytophthora fragariae]KAE9069915.1 hypothetical protein PF007_g27134 [Phytophthora fragariae]